MSKTRKELMQKLNQLLNTDFHWGRLSKLDLERLVQAIKDRFWMQIDWKQK